MGDQTVTELGGQQAAVQWETPIRELPPDTLLAKLPGYGCSLLSALLPAQAMSWLLRLPRQLLTLQSWRWPQPHAQREVDLGQSLLLI